MTTRLFQEDSEVQDTFGAADDMLALSGTADETSALPVGETADETSAFLVGEPAEETSALR